MSKYNKHTQPIPQTKPHHTPMHAFRKTFNQVFEAISNAMPKVEDTGTDFWEYNTRVYLSNLEVFEKIYCELFLGTSQEQAGAKALDLSNEIDYATLYDLVHQNPEVKQRFNQMVCKHSLNNGMQQFPQIFTRGQ